MEGVEIVEVRRRAEIICAAAVESLRSELKALHSRNAAKGALRSGATVKESAAVARTSIRSYFNELEQFVRSRPDGRAGFDAAIIDAVSDSTAALISSVDYGLLKTATLAGDPNLVRAIQQEVTTELSASQETFRSNIRAHWASRASVNSFTVTDKFLFGVEALCLVAICVTVGLWINDPRGTYEPFLALLGVAGAATEMCRRVAKRHAP